MNSDDADRDLVAAVLATQGRTPAGPPHRLSGHGELNRHWLVRDTTGQRLVARIYHWPFDDEEPFDRLAKEQWLLGELQARGAPVPQVHTGLRHNGGGVLLLGEVPGQLLGDLGVGDRAAWRAAGAALRAVHEVRVPQLTEAGIVVEGGVRAYPGGWGGHLLEQVSVQAGRLAAHRPGLGADLDRAVGLVAAAVPALDARPLAVLHGDAHPWNVLIDDAGRRPRACWLDWEFAMVGDPIYDLVRMYLARMRPIGRPPTDLLDGYGAAPAEPIRRVYELAYYIWMANDSRHHPHRATYDDAGAYLARLRHHLDRLAAVL